VELQGRVEELARAGIGVAAISYDPVDKLAAFAKERGITYTLLSDVGSKVITEFGILNTIALERLGPNGDDPAVQADAARFGVGWDGAAGVPFPGTFVVDADGVVRSRHFEPYYRERNTAANVMLKLGVGMSSVAAIEGSTPELGFTAYPTDAAVVAGSRLAIVVDVEPKPTMHVYAPGAEKNGYRVTGLALDDHPLIRVEPLDYPPSEIYHFKPLDEYVPVYQEPFRLQQEIVVLASDADQEALAAMDELTVTGTFRYQACDDEICYLPEAVPLTFTLEIVKDE